MVALLPKPPPDSVGIGEASFTGVGTVGAAVGDAVGVASPAGLVELLQATASSRGRVRSNPAVRRTAFLTVGQSRLSGLRLRTRRTAYAQTVPGPGRHHRDRTP
ncbi:hypothetical protein GCM10009639_00330 [Kitasatospora putterlickiae]|uniref:Uncharacterized protein n=1 Tax=Kitasatospora putterlickiae TaxID=221725 RepID=A0ABP4IB08_9ACTN